MAGKGYFYCQPHGASEHTRTVTNRDAMSAGNQDLRGYAAFRYGTTPGGKRWFCAELPTPGWSKAIRVAVAKNGGRFLSLAAKEYRNWFEQSVIVSPPPETPWLRGPYVVVSVGFYKKFDTDAHSGGLLDDAVYAGLAVDDFFCEGLLSPMVRVTSVDEQRINFSGVEI
jgi:hypothetical protein